MKFSLNFFVTFAVRKTVLALQDLYLKNVILTTMLPANNFDVMKIKDIKFENIFKVQHLEREKVSQRCSTCGTSSASLSVTAVSPYSN
jgi:hypothetical protein